MGELVVAFAEECEDVVQIGEIDFYWNIVDPWRSDERTSLADY